MHKIFTLLFIFIILSTQAQNTIEKHFGDAVDCSGINVIQTFDNGFLITANKYPISPYSEDLFIIKTNQAGDTLWTRTFPLNSGLIAKGIQTYDSGFVFTGKVDNSLLLFKVNSHGDSLWTNTYNFGTTYAYGRSLIESSDHTLFVVGENFIGTNICCTPLVIQADLSGNLLNRITLPVDLGRAYDIIETPDSNFILSYSEICNSPPIPMLSKITKKGNFLWSKTYSTYCQCNVTLTNDNGILISGSQINTYKPYLIKTDSAGNVIWNKSHSDYNVFNEKLEVTQSHDHGYLMVGGKKYPSVSDVILLKVNSLGDSVWCRAYGGLGDDFGNSIIATKDNGFAIVGYTTSFNSAFKEVYFLKTDSIGLVTSSKKYETGVKLITIFPNPFSYSTTIQTEMKFKNANLSISNSTGQEVKQLININGNTITLSRDNLPSGIYFLRLTQENKLVSIEKLIVIDN